MNRWITTVIRLLLPLMFLDRIDEYQSTPRDFEVNQLICGICVVVPGCCQWISGSGRRNGMFCLKNL
ncbi:hypothetical protein [uncultured Methanospirillum sp.]|uniref:hypothetical protein n=1 Tax=uncultured Methanospirillum sp. TaxID=262503 RepID=UPI0029C87545|nr:hypothetical protein [uncultured Methanospirillum sp.]